MDQAGYDGSRAGDGGCVRVSDEPFDGGGDPGSIAPVSDNTYSRKCIFFITDSKKCIVGSDSKKGLNMDVFNSFFYTSFQMKRRTAVR